LKEQTWFVFHSAQSVGFSNRIFSFIEQALHTLFITSRAKFFPESTDITDTMLLLDEYPLLCHVLSQDTETSIHQIQKASGQNNENH